MARLFKRAVNLQVETPAVGDYFREQVVRTTITDLRVKFNIVRHLGSEPNSAVISIFNLAERTRAEFVKKPVRVKLFAGYESDIKHVFTGDLIWGTSVKPAVTWVTELQLGDGQRAYKHARASRTFKAGTSARTVIKDLARTMGLKVPANVDEAKEFAKQFTTGVTVEGPSQKELSRLMKVSGHEWSIQNGGLQVLKPGASNSKAPRRVAVDTGLLGVPEVGAPQRPQGDSTRARKYTYKSKPVLSVQMRLAGDINPGDRIFLDSKNLSGYYLVQRVTDIGDTEGKEWYSNLEATAISV